MDKMKWKKLAPPFEVWANDWITIQDNFVQLPTGVKAHFYALKDVDGAAVLAVDDQVRAIINRQFRPALGQVILELPGGGVRAGEEPLETLQREIAEEAGIRVRDIIDLGSYYRNPSRDTGSMHVFFARVDGETSSRQERYECIETVHMPLDELFEKVQNNEIQDIATIFAVMMLRIRLANGKIKI